MMDVTQAHFGNITSIRRNRGISSKHARGNDVTCLSRPTLLSRAQEVVERTGRGAGYPSTDARIDERKLVLVRGSIVGARNMS